jgi:glycosyltransferase involved in cell wall biosynthesis
MRDASIVIGTVAVLREEKNLGMLIDAFHQIRPAHPGAHLLIVGSGPMENTLKEQARALGLSDSCTFVPSVCHPAAWMRSMDVFVLPSRSEAFSNALLEAMACGCCPVGSRVGGTPELIEHNRTGLLFEAGNTSELAQALSSLASNATRCRELGDSATRFVHERFTIAIAAARLAAIYRELLAERQPARISPAVI